MFKTARKLPVAIVAGGAGFLGSHLCEALLLQNLKVVCLDNLKTGKEENISHLLKKPNFEFLETDIKNPLPDSLWPVDYVFHLVGVEEYLAGRDLDLESLLVNAQGTFNLLELARGAKAKFLLVSSVDIYSGVLSSLSLSSYFGPDIKSSQRFSHREAKRYAEALTVSYFQKYNLEARIIRVADVYGPRMPLSGGGEINQLFVQAKDGEKLTLFGDGLKIIYPTYVSDVVYGISKAMFSEGTKGGIYTLVNPQEVTVLQLAYALKEASDKKLEIEFKEKKEEISFPLPKIELAKTQKDLGWQAQVELKEGIEKTLASFRNQESGIRNQELGTKETEPTVIQEPPKTKFTIPTFHLPSFKFPFPRVSLSVFSSIFYFLSSIFVILFLPFAIFFYNFSQGVQSLNSAQKSFLSLDFKSAQNQAKISQEKFNLAQKNFVYPKFVLQTFGQKEKASETESLLSFGQKASLASQSLATSSLSLVNLFKNAASYDSKSDLSEDLILARRELDQALANLFLAQLSLTEIPADFSLPLVDLKLQSIKNNLSSHQKTLSEIRQALEILPETIGFLGKRTYLLVFQNNMEIRPTGGFIGSYALLTFNRGKLEKLEVQDVYTADGQLKEKIEPPKPFKDLLKQDSWYLRDANWSPDFPESALRLEWFLEKEIGQKVDGVVAIDLTLAQYLLSALGPQKLLDFNETVSAENLFLKAETYSEVGFFPGSTQKKDFMASLSRTLLTSFLSSKEGDWGKILKAVEKGLLEKHLLLFLHDKTLAQMVAERDWDGKVKNYEGDYLMVVETNLGGNKANFFVERKILDRVTVGRELDLTHRLILNYDNTSPNETWPAGKYRQWLRVLVPKGAELKAVENGENRNLSQVEVATVRDKTIFGLAVEVPIQTKRNVVLEYKLPKEMVLTGKSPAYHLYLQKQPGVVDDSYSLEIAYPAYLTIAQASPSGLTQAGVVSYSSDLKTDREFKVVFSR